MGLFILTTKDREECSVLSARIMVTCTMRHSQEVAGRSPCYSQLHVAVMSVADEL